MDTINTFYKSDFDNIRKSFPVSILEEPRWVAFKLEKRNGKTTKPPVSPVKGEKIGCNNPASWATFEEAVAFCISHHLAGVGIMLDDGGLYAIDIDDCIDEAGNMTSYARRIIDKFEGAYAEISISGRGVHILGLGDPIMGINCNLRNLPHGNKLEMATYNKYITISGNCIHPMVATKNYAEDFFLLYSHQKELNESNKTEKAPIKHDRKEKSMPVKEGHPPLLTDDDLHVLELIYRSKDAKLKQLLDEPSDLNASEADYRLCLRLMYWCHQKDDQVDRIFRNSIRMREKWDRPYSDGSTYGKRTIKKAKDNFVQY